MTKIKHTDGTIVRISTRNRVRESNLTPTVVPRICEESDERASSVLLRIENVALDREKTLQDALFIELFHLLRNRD